MPWPVLQVWFDPVCPWCFIGHARLKRARAAVGEDAVQVEWRPYQLAPDVLAGGTPRRAFFAGKFGGPERADAAWARVAAAGASDGVAFAFDRIKTEPNTLDAHRAVRLAARSGRAEPMIEALFHAHFQRGLDIGRAEVLAQLAEESGLSGAAMATHLASEQDRAETRADAARARLLGVRGVPAYGVDDTPLPPEATGDLTALVATLARTAPPRRGAEPVLPGATINRT